MSGGIFDFLFFSAFLLSACPSEKHGRACGAFSGVRVRELLMKVMTKVTDGLSKSVLFIDGLVDAGGDQANVGDQARGGI